MRAGRHSHTRGSAPRSRGRGGGRSEDRPSGPGHPHRPRRRRPRGQVSAGHRGAVSHTITALTHASDVGGDRYREGDCEGWAWVWTRRTRPRPWDLSDRPAGRRPRRHPAECALGGGSRGTDASVGLQASPRVRLRRPRPSGQSADGRGHAAPGPKEVRTQGDLVASMLAGQFPAVTQTLLEAKADLTAFFDFPHPQWHMI